MPKKVCPNDPAHNRFITTGHVMQDWVVDGDGTFQEVENECVQVTHEADTDNIWTCKECGAEAVEEQTCPECKIRPIARDGLCAKCACDALIDKENAK